MTESELRDLLERATDRIAPADLADVALAGTAAAHRRRRAYAAGVAAASVLVVVLVGLTVGTGGDRGPSPAPSPTPTPSVTPTVVSDEGPATQPRWDPFTVADAPLRESALPRQLAPPETPPVLEPMSGVVVAWPQEGHDLRLLDDDGEWHTVPLTRDAVTGTLRDVVRPSISHDGTRVAFSADDGIRVIEVTTGEERTIGWPSEIAPPWDTAPELKWLPGDEGFVVLQWKNNWLVGLDGESRRAPYRLVYPSLAVDPEGAVYQNDYKVRSLLAWQGDQIVHEVPMVQCERMVAGHGLVACTAGSLQPYRSGPVVVDSATGDVIAYAPIKDRNSVYSDNGHLTAMGFLDEDTALLLVGPADFRTMEVGEEAWHLIAWEFRTGAFERITSGDSRLQTIAVAPRLLDSP